MKDRSKHVINEIDKIIIDYKNFITPYIGQEVLSEGFPRNALYTHYTLISDALLRYSLHGSQYQTIVKKFNEEIDITNIRQVNKALIAFVNILIALKQAYEKDYFDTIEGQINNEVFADFLSMAENFLENSEQYKHPAAFLIGGVLEEHLRKLAIKNQIAIFKKDGKFRSAGDLNADLKKADAYDLNEQQAITSWLGIRNDADHAHWDKYSKEKVEVMLKDVRRLIKQYPA